MLIPKVKTKEFEKFGFKKCKGEYGKNDCYYLCIAKGEKCFLSAICVLTLMTGRITTQEYTKMQIVDTETTEHTLILFTS